MATKNVRFIATRTVTKPTKVQFKTKSGETVTFRALRTYKRKPAVHARSRSK